MITKHVSTLFASIFILAVNIQPCFSFQDNKKLTIHASEMTFSQNVTIVDDHVMIWGMGRNRYTWVALPRSHVPYPSFLVDVEVSADTAANRWPNIGLAFNDSSNLAVEEKVSSTDWHEFSLGQFTPSDSDSIIYFVYTNDYFNQSNDQDLNLRIRNVTFHEATEDIKSVKVSWEPNKEDSLKGYNILYGLGSGNYFKKIDVGLVTEKLLNLPAGWTYYFVVTAYGPTKSRESLPSEEVMIKLEKLRAIDCDIDSNGLVEMSDWLAFRASFNSDKGDSRYREKADLNKDDKIDNLDEEIANSACLGKWGMTSN